MTATEKLLTEMEIPVSFITNMKNCGKFYECSTGFAWLKNCGTHYQMMCESTEKPWSSSFIKMLLKSRKDWDKDVITKSEDPDVISFCCKAGAEKAEDTCVIWRLKNV